MNAKWTIQITTPIFKSQEKKNAEIKIFTKSETLNVATCNVITKPDQSVVTVWD